MTRETGQMVAEARGSSDARVHIGCLVRRYLAHLAELGTPGWGARFVAQTTTDPAARARMFRNPELDALLLESFRGALAHAPTERPDRVPALRYRTMRVMTVRTRAEQERTAADGTAVGRELVADTLVDAGTGILLAPVGPRTPDRAGRPDAVIDAPHRRADDSGRAAGS